MTEKYYTPKLEDIHIGYECQINFHAEPLKESQYTNWNNYIITPKLIKQEKLEGGGYSLGVVGELLFDTKMDHFRTLYLTKEQVIAEGWEDITYDEKLEEGWLFEKDTLHIRYFIPTSRIGIAGTGKDKKWYYNGTCNSINEFRKIIKLLGL